MSDRPLDMTRHVPVDLKADGVLWAVNAAVFHPRGFALGLAPDGALVLLGDGHEPVQYAESSEEEFRRFEALLAAARESAPLPTPEPETPVASADRWDVPKVPGEHLHRAAMTHVTLVGRNLQVSSPGVLRHAHGDDEPIPYREHVTRHQHLGWGAALYVGESPPLAYPISRSRLAVCATSASYLDGGCGVWVDGEVVCDRPAGHLLQRIPHRGHAPSGDGRWIEYDDEGLEVARGGGWTTW